MTGKKLVTLTLVMLFVLALMGGLAAAEGECPAAPAVAVQILQDNDIDFRYEAGEVEHRNGTMRTVYENYISMVAQTMTNEAAFPAYKCDGTWDEDDGYVDKCDEEAYYWAVYNYLRFLDADLECPFCGVLDPEASGAVFADNEDGTGTLTVTLIDLCGNPVLPEDFPIVPPTSTHDNLGRQWTTYFRANSDSKNNPYYYFIGGRHFNADYPGLSSTSANHFELGVYIIILESVFDYEQKWKIGIGPWLFEEDVYVIEEVNIKIETGRSSDGLALWLEASAYDEIEGEWTDWSGNNNHAQAPDGYKPTLGELNGMPSIQFNGSSYLVSSDSQSLDITPHVTILAVARTQNIDNGVRRIVSKGHSTWNEPYYMYTLWNYDRSIGFGVTIDGSRRWSHDDANIQANKAYIWGGRYDGEQRQTYIDGTIINQVSLSGAMSINDQPLYIGGTQGPDSTFWDGDIAEILVFDRALSDSELGMVEAYLSAKYGI